MYILNNRKIVIQIILCLVWTVLLAGCSEESISLEEALMAERGSSFMSGTEWAESGLSSLNPASIEQQKDSEPALIYVYVCGAVRKPGVYSLEEGSRIVAAIEAAGGFLEEAGTEAVNLAAPAVDGMQITVPDQEAAENQKKQAEEESRGRIDLNHATVEELCRLPGIGEAKAEAIAAYRDEIGRFHSIEQIKNVSGIGENLFKQIRDSIYIE